MISPSESTTAATGSTFSERVVSRLSTGVFGRRSSRRGFLATTAVVGSAIATKPWKYLVEPASAYDAVCGDGNECADGWTAFCCSVSGANQCPAGSFVGGWWKADNSGFCCGAARYYVDCNALCGSSWIGHGYCNNNGTCDRRRVAINQFRYGQCNQQISCYGPVVCRVVTCTPPWQYDAACTTASATDNRTVSHNAPCLPGNCPSSIVMLWYDYGGPGGGLGQMTQAEAPDPAGRGRYALFQYGGIYSVAGPGTHEVDGAISDHFRAIGGTTSVLGFPTTNETGTPDLIGRYNHFENGSIYWTAGTGAQEVHGRIGFLWALFGWERSPLGYPITDQRLDANNIPYNQFQAGVIFDHPQAGLNEVHGAICGHYYQLRGQYGVLGYPTSGETPAANSGAFNHFQNGSIFWSLSTGAHEVHGTIRQLWAALGWERSPLGYPITDQSVDSNGTPYNQFNAGVIFDHPQAGLHEVHGAICGHYYQLRGQYSGLGYPTTNETPVGDGIGAYNDFQGGSIYWTVNTGAHNILEPIRGLWHSLGAQSGPLGYPITDQNVDSFGTPYNQFNAGVIFNHPQAGLHELHGAICGRFYQLRGQYGVLGYPTTNETPVGDGIGAYNRCQNGAIYWSVTSGARWMGLAIFDRWTAIGGRGGSLGYPISDEYPSGTNQRVDFQYGSLIYDPSTGTVSQV